MRNLTLLTDLYQLTMLNGYFEKNIHEDMVIFDMFFRKNACNGGYTIVCGIEQFVEYINNIHFSEDDLAYLKSLNLFSDKFLTFLKDFKFTGDIYAVEEGTIMFPNEPILTVKAPLYQAQLIETALLTIINFQSLIATKASRVCFAAQGDPVFEFGLRRAQGPDAGTYGARAAVIGGCSATANVLAGKMFDIPVVGTQAHSWIQKFDTEVEAFKAYADIYPDKCLLLVDTYNVLNSGLPNAIKVFKDLREKGHKPLGIRLDSGDLKYLSNQCNSPSLGGVYKLAASFKNGEFEPKIKLSEDPEKISNPGYKKVFRIYNEENKAEADLIMLHNESIDESKPLTIFHPTYTWKTKSFENYTVKELLKPLFINGECKYKHKNVMGIREYVNNELNSLWEEYRRLSNPQTYKVDLSRDLWYLKTKMIDSKKFI